MIHGLLQLDGLSRKRRRSLLLNCSRDNKLETPLKSLRANYIIRTQGCLYLSTLLYHSLTLSLILVFIECITLYKNQTLNLCIVLDVDCREDGLAEAACHPRRALH